MSFNLALMAAAALGAGAVAYVYFRRSRTLEKRLTDANEELERLQRTFNRFAPAGVVDDILEQRSLDIAETREVTILFADLRGFTAISEEWEPAELVALLNEYFQRMDQAVDKHGGFVSKFLGDGLLVLFGALHPNPWQSTDAVEAALKMQRQVRELDTPDAHDLSLSVGIHRGPVVAGVVGSLDVKEFTVIGRHVNLASRVEELTRTFDADILVTEPVKNDLDPSFSLTRNPAQSVKGVQDPVVTYAVEGSA